MLYLWSPQQFFIALRLVACAQNGLEVALKSLNVAVPPPKFVSSLSTSLGSGHAPPFIWMCIHFIDLDVINKLRFIYLQHETSSPLLAGGVAADIPWVVKVRNLHVCHLFFFFFPLTSLLF